MSQRPHGRKRNDQGQAATAYKRGEGLNKKEPLEKKGLLSRIKNFFIRNKQ